VFGMVGTFAGAGFWAPSLAQGGLGLRRIDSSDIPDTANVAITAQVLAA
jgi:hypothetical protein